VGIVDAKYLHSVRDPREDDVAEREPGVGEALVEVDVDDVFVLLRRVLGESDGAVGAPVEPALVLAKPGVVAAALGSEVESDFEPMLVRGFIEAAEVIEGAKLGVECVVPARGAADGVWAARVAGLGDQAVVPPCPGC